VLLLFALLLTTQRLVLHRPVLLLSPLSLPLLLVLLLPLLCLAAGGMLLLLEGCGCYVWVAPAAAAKHLQARHAK
jgi:hypothetical protein